MAPNQGRILDPTVALRKHEPGVRVAPKGGSVVRGQTSEGRKRRFLGRRKGEYDRAVCCKGPLARFPRHIRLLTRIVPHLHYNEGMF